MDLIKLYDGIINDGINFTTKQIKEWGYSSRDIKKLIDEEIIRRVKIGHYEFLDVNKLYIYGKRLLYNDKDMARKGFVRCLEIDSKHGGATFNLFFNAILNKQYDKAVSFLGVLLETNNMCYQRDFNCYLYLLNFICDLPDEYKQFVNSMQIEDLFVNDGDKRYSNIEGMNEIRKAIYNGKFAYAALNLQVYFKSSKKKQSTDILIRKLLYDVQNSLISTLKDLWEHGEYDKFITLLKTKQERFSLSKLEYIYLYLVKSYVDMITYREVLPKLEVKDNTIFSYIMANEFSKALEEKNDDLLLIDMLNSICSLENTLQNEKLQSEKKNREENKDLLALLFNALLANDMPYSEKVLEEYLKNIQKEEYKLIVLNHIKLCVLDGDLTFTKPISLLVQLKNDTFKIDLDYYNELLQDYIKEGNLSAAKLVLEIVITLREKEKINVEREVKIEVETKGNSLENVALISEEISTDGNKIGEQVSDYLQINYQVLVQNKDLVLLVPMTLEEREEIIKQIRTLANVKFFTIGDKEPRRIVLHYIPEEFRYIDAKAIMQNLKRKYNRRKYREVVEDCKKLLTLKFVSAYTCFRMGMAYGHLGEYQRAIDYLIIAQEESKKDKKMKTPYDFTKVIKQFDELADKKNEAVKPYVDVKLDEFNLSAVDTDFEAIKGAVLVNGHDARSICYYLGYNDNQMARVLLLLARECFMNGSVDKGESYIKLFEKMPGKSKENIELAEEVKRNKKLYINGGATLVRFRSNINEDS